MIFVNARDSRDALPPGQLADWKNCDSRNGAQERTRTSTTLRPLAPEASASASSATRARVKKKLALMSQPDLRGIFNSARGLLLCQRKARPTAGGEVRIAERAPANVGTRRLSLHQLL